jgi:cytoskeletal protein CcmA (bactofilin family)
MALQSPFFNKRETDAHNSRFGNSQPGALTGGSTNAVPLNSPPATGISTPLPAAAGVTKEGESKLTVGPNIKLKGVEITDCDTLVVEGSVEATMDSRVIQISERGSFKGSVEIDIAEIRGEFDGNLIVRQKLMIYSTGKVTGKIRYGKVVIEEGGQLSGDITFGAAANTNKVSGLVTGFKAVA